MTEDEIGGWHHQLNGHEFEQTPGDGEGQGSLACSSPWGRNESDSTEQLNNSLLALEQLTLTGKAITQSTKLTVFTVNS